MEKISGVVQASLPSLGFKPVEGLLGDGDEVYLNTGQLADLYRFSLKAPKASYTFTVASSDFPVALTWYRLAPKRSGYVALQETQVFALESAHASATLPAGQYAIKINSASIDHQQGRYGLALSGAPGEAKPAGDVPRQGKAGGIQVDGVMIQRTAGGGGISSGGEF
jgi:hypothetical protein